MPLPLRPGNDAAVLASRLEPCSRLANASVEKGDKAMALTPPSQLTFILAVLTVFSLLVHYANVAIPYSKWP